MNHLHLHRTLFLIAATLLLLHSLPIYAQQSAFQSSNGETSLYLQGGGSTTLNFGDTKLSMGRYIRFSDRQLIYGFDIFGKASNGATTLFTSKPKIPEGGGDFVVGWHQKVDPNAPITPTSTNDQWALLDVGYSRSSFYASNTAVAPAQAKHYFDRYRAVAAYNKIAGSFALGIATGAERRNNLDDLKTATFQSSIISATGTGTPSVVNSQAGFLGVYRRYIAAPLYTDIVYVLPKCHFPGFDKSGLALDGFTRSNLAARSRSVDGGLGIFITKKNAPTNLYGGIAASWNDGKSKVALIASWAF